MKRVQIYLEDDQYNRLKTISNGRDLARLIREAVEIVYPKREHGNFKALMDEVAGIWKDRADIGIFRKGKKRRDYLTSLWAKAK